MFSGHRGAVAFAGTIEGRRRLRDGQHLETIGIQLYSVRRGLARDFEGTLARVASIGFKEVEFAGYFNRRPREVRTILDRYGLAAPSVHIPIEVARQDWAGALAAANVIGSPVCRPSLAAAGKPAHARRLQASRR